jgi:pimeloyl-ACP methyl ester carboxylesterase
MTLVNSKTITLDGHALSYFDSYDDSHSENAALNTQPVLLFCHGLLGDKNQWQGIISGLSQQYRCIAVDLWAHGETTSIPEQINSLQTIAAQLIELLTALGVQQCGLIAQGSGCAIAAEMALLAPKHISALVMINGFIGFEPEVNCSKYQAWLDQVVTDNSISAELALNIAAQFFTQAPVTDAEIAHTSANINTLKTALMAIPAAKIPGLAKMASMSFYKRDTLALAEQLCVPSLVLASSNNALRTGLEAYLMQDCIDGSQLMPIPGGHWVHMEQEGKVCAILTDFLAKAIKA